MKNLLIVVVCFVAVSLMLSLVLAFVEILWQFPHKDDLLQLTGLLLSWPVITAGVTIGAGTVYRDEIKGVLQRAFTSQAKSGQVSP